MKRGKNGECQGFVDRRRQSRGCTDGMSVCTAREESVAFSDAKKEMFDGGGETHKATWEALFSRSGGPLKLNGNYV